MWRVGTCVNLRNTAEPWHKGVSTQLHNYPIISQLVSVIVRMPSLVLDISLHSNVVSVSAQSWSPWSRHQSRSHTRDSGPRLRLWASSQHFYSCHYLQLRTTSHQHLRWPSLVTRFTEAVINSNYFPKGKKCFLFSITLKKLDKIHPTIK